MINFYPNIDDNKQVSFSGLFSRKKKPDVFMLPYGKKSTLNGESRIAIPEESIINFRDTYKIDLTKSPLKEKIKKLKKNDSIVIGRADINPDDTYISRKQFELRKIDKVLYLCNLSQTNGTEFTLLNPNQTIAPKQFPKPVNQRRVNPFVNVDPAYLKGRYGQPQQNFRNLFEQKYNDLRIARYSESSTFGKTSVADVQKMIMTAPRNGQIFAQNGWHFREFQYGLPGNITNRISMNVKASPDLIKELDELMITGRYTDKKGRKCRVPQDKQVPGYYKTYDSANKWTVRHDPITMYFTAPPTPELLDAVCDISQRYARPSSNGLPLVNALPGKPWICTEKEPMEADIKPVLAKASAISKDLETAICDYCYEHWDYKNGYRDFFVSAGQFAAVKFVVDEYDAYLRLPSVDRTA
ncbi:FHA domain-containing protein [bacterium]|nr:FHA domain-containing protein [bacterium]